MRALRLRMSSRALALITVLGVLMLALGLATLLAMSAQAKGPDGGDNPPAQTLTPQEELAKAVIHLKESLGTSNIQGVMIPGTTWVASRWEPNNATKRQWLKEKGSLAWPVIPTATCDSDEECEEDMDDACSESGNGGCDSETVQVSEDENGGHVCSCDCTSNGAVAFAICGPN